MGENGCGRRSGPSSVPLRRPGSTPQGSGCVMLWPFGERVKDMAKRVSLADVARAAGVGKATASRALSGREEVGAATRAPVRDIAADMGYQPHRVAQSLRTGRFGVLAVSIRPTDPDSRESCCGLRPRGQPSWDISSSSTCAPPATRPSLLVPVRRTRRRRCPRGRCRSCNRAARRCHTRWCRGRPRTLKRPPLGASTTSFLVSGKTPAHRHDRARFDHSSRSSVD